MDKRLQPDSIQSFVRGGYDLILSPAGMVAGKFFMNDPVGMNSLGLNKLNQLRLDDRIELYNNYYVSKDQRHLLMWLIPENEPNETTENARLLDLLSEDLKSLSTDQVKAEYYGTTAVAVGNARRIKKDIQSTVGIAVIILLVFLTFYFRKPTTFILLFLPVILGAGFALATLYLVKGTISAISLGIGSLILGITIDFSLHFLNHMREENEVESVLRSTARPILTSCLTTASAFMCLALVGSDALTDLGLFASISVIVAALATLLVLSNLVKSKKGDSTRKSAPKKGFMQTLSQYPLHKKPWAILASLAITAVLLFFFSEVRFDGDLSKMNYQSEALEEAATRLNSINGQQEKTIYLVARSSDQNEVFAENQRILQVVQNLQKDYPEIHAASLAPIVLSKEEQERKLALWNNFWTNERIDGLRQMLIEAGTPYKFKETAFKRFYKRLEKDYEPLSFDEAQELKALNLSAFTGQTGKDLIIYSPLRIGQTPADSLKLALRKEGVTVFDKSDFANGIILALKEDFSSLIGLSLISVFLILLIFFRHSLLALITLLPVAISWVWVTGLMVWLDVPFNIFNIIVSSLIFGLGIDYAIFITSGVLHELKTGEQKVSVYKTSILLSGLTTLAGIGVLIFAKHPALHSMALISLLGISVAIWISFTLQYFLLDLLILKRKKKGVEPFTTVNIFWTLFTFFYFLVGSVIITVLSAIALIIPVKPVTRQRFLAWSISRYMLSLIAVSRNVKRSLDLPKQNPSGKPVVYFANHESFLDILLILALNPKNILLTNDWVYKSPVFGFIVQRAGFFQVSEGYEKSIPHLSQKVKEGFNICVFPEGTRSVFPKIQRFHRGAFFIAEELKLDMVPILLHGFGDAMTKSDDFILKNGSVTTRYLEPIRYEDRSWGDNYRERAKSVRKDFMAQFLAMRFELETVHYHRHRLFKHYLYKGLDLEKRAKGVIRSNQASRETINRQLPLKGRILVVGETLGLGTFYYSWFSEKREFTSWVKQEADLYLPEQSFTTLKNDKIQFQAFPDGSEDHSFDALVIDQTDGSLPSDQWDKLQSWLKSGKLQANQIFTLNLAEEWRNESNNWPIRPEHF
ncbi:MMPL family transporter [bacterium SCSIO 12741]|nr:MMPL family transporter [bacterium SCSIO 12741]